MSTNLIDFTSILDIRADRYFHHAAVPCHAVYLKRPLRRLRGHQNVPVRLYLYAYPIRTIVHLNACLGCGHGCWILGDGPRRVFFSVKTAHSEMISYLRKANKDEKTLAFDNITADCLGL
ncbi:hypothetical protein PILCRDRAFT_2073 [Piloderma croceum F 1598]|uniref:Uncharacterized protein n=1 Tax=Piloderma croceum (strain F 1598) TaxID=765440 RepID=A0A0C3GDJ9_PILCF|nr:hypothetical protein PILCRDRAFT_2073 [Piloderma croceum F 1598]